MKQLLYYVCAVTLLCCQNTLSRPEPESTSNLIPLVVTKSSDQDIETIKEILQKQTDKIEEMEKKIISYQNQIEDYSHIIDSNLTNNTQMAQLKNKYEILLDSNGTKSIEQDYLNTLNRVQKKIQILEDRTFFTDSLYFEIINDMVRIENKISSLILSFKEMNNLSDEEKSVIIPTITDEQYKIKYKESLAQYMHEEWDLSLNGFNYLIHANKNHDLADNCQYWIGEVYYALNDYKRSIIEFEKVYSFSGTNKADDAQFKIGFCYMNIGQVDRARQEFKNLMEFYPNSEYYTRAQDYLKQN